MRPTSSKHGLERKFKPWRKGKASSKKRVCVDGEDGGARPRNRSNNASLKNLLRSQKRLLGRLQKGKDADDGGTKTTNEEEMVDGARQRITMLEKEIVAHADREREKKNATK
jgi:hypothetical protein